MSTAVAALVWDYDGTLVDTRGMDEAAVAALVAAEPGAAAGVETFWHAEGRPLRERLETAWPGRSDEVIRLFDGDSVPRVFPGIRRAVSRLAELGLPMAVVSSRRLDPLRRGLVATGLDMAMGPVIGLESVAVPKPDPEGLLRALHGLGVVPARAVYVGDRDDDMQAARCAGVDGWLALWGHRHPTAPRWGSRGVRSPAEVVRLVGDLLEEAPPPAG